MPTFNEIVCSTAEIFQYSSGNISTVSSCLTICWKINNFAAL